MPRVLFVAPHRPDRSPSQRYRFEKFVPYWKSKGWEFTSAWVVDEEDDRHLYARGALLPKAKLLLKSFRRRRLQVQLAKGHDLIFLQRETFMTGGTRYEQLLKATGVPLVYDIDDAIWLMNFSEGNRYLRWLKEPRKAERILRLADHVIAGNSFLLHHALKFNPHAEMIPTVVDTNEYVPLERERKGPGPLVIGWTGSRTTIPHLERALPALRQLARQGEVPFILRVVSDVPFTAEGIHVEHRPWRSATEVQDLQDMDIGIMPLEENEWSKGKCGFKGLQYMALGKPVVLQDHGANREIIVHGTNGFLASSQQQWTEFLSRLLQDADLRRRIGNAARKTVEERYSVNAWKDRYLELFNELIDRNKHGNHNRPQAHHP